MNSNKVVRIVLDATLSLTMVFEMLIQFTGEFLHEVVGFAFFATVIVHVALSAKWMKSTARNAKAGKLTARRTALAVMGILLALTTIALGVSSVAISGILSSAGLVWPIGSYSAWAFVHTLSAYALCALVVVHLAMHWAFVASAFKVPYDPSRRRAISAGVNAMAAAGVLALGVTAAGKMTPQPANAGQGAFALDGASGVGSSSGALGSDDESSASESAGNAGAVSSPSSKSGKSHKKGRSSGTADSTLGSTPDSASGSISGSAPDDAASGSTSGGSSGGSNSQPSGSGGSSAGGSAGSGVSGICALCRKQCSLSSPKCDKPYEAGLL